MGNQITVAVNTYMKYYAHIRFFSNGNLASKILNNQNKHKESGMSQIETIPTRAQFKSLVLGHINWQLDENEWKRFRLMASTNSSSHLATPAQLPQETPEALFDAYTSEDGISVPDILKGLRASDQAIEIGAIEERPVYYIAGKGIYMWDIDGFLTMMFWCSYPAYPPGW